MRKFSFVASLIVVAGASADRAEAQAAPAADGPTCTVAQAVQSLPAEVRETSGLARGRGNASMFWTHNDSGFEPMIYALDEKGAVKARVRVKGAALKDWEDIESGECEGGNCLYIADIGDNARRRKFVTIYEVAEPDLTSTEVTTRRTINAVYADGAQDAEAFFRLPSGEMYIVTKGRHGKIKLYRFSTAGVNGNGTLQLVREVAPQPANELDRVTSSTASPNGKWVAIRTYRTLYVYQVADLIGSGAPSTTYSLASLGEKQGESITLDDDGTIWMTSEAENPKDLPTFARLSCTLDD